MPKALIIVSLYMCLFVGAVHSQDKDVSGERTQEAQPADSQDLADTITKSFKKAIEEFDIRKAKERVIEEEEAARALDSFVKKWLEAQGLKRKRELRATIEQDWQNLLSTPPQHIDYYLRDFLYSVKHVDIIDTDSVTYPYKANVDIRELLYVERGPLIAEPRTDYEFTADTIIRIGLQYQKAQSSWRITGIRDLNAALNKGWPQAIRKRHASFFIPAGNKALRPMAAHLSLKKRASQEASHPRVPHIENFDRDFTYTDLAISGTALVFVYTGKNMVSEDGVPRLRNGRCYVLKISKDYNEGLFGFAGASDMEFGRQLRVAEAETLMQLNPGNRSPYLPRLAGVVDMAKTVFGRDHDIYADALLTEFVRGSKLLSDYTKKLGEPSLRYGRRTLDLLVRINAKIFVDLTLKILKGYKEAYADRGYVHGDLDSSGILVTARGSMVEQAVFVDNDTATRIIDTSAGALYRKALSKHPAVSDDRKARSDQIHDSPADMCLPRDDVYALCKILYGCIGGMLPPHLTDLKRILAVSTRVSQKRYVLDELIAEVEQLKNSTKGDYAPQLKPLPQTTKTMIAISQSA